MESNIIDNAIQKLIEKFPYCHIHENELYWSCGVMSERIKIFHIDSIEFYKDSAVLHSEIGSWMGYHEITFFADTAVLPEKEDVVYYKQGKKK